VQHLGEEDTRKKPQTRRLRPRHREKENMIQKKSVRIGKTALLLASKKSHTEIVELFKQAGAKE